MFNALVEFIESQKKKYIYIYIYIPPKRLNYKSFISKIFELLFPSERNVQPPNKRKKKSNALGQSSGIS